MRRVGLALVGLGLTTAVATVSPGVAHAAVPAAPTQLDAFYNFFAGTTELSWVDNANDELGFEIMRAELVGDQWANWTFIGVVLPNVTEYVDTPATTATFAYVVRAYNDDGRSAWAVDTTVPTPNAPERVAAFSDGDNTVLVWDDVSEEETSFQVGRARYNPGSQTWGEWEFFNLESETEMFFEPARSGTYALLVRAVQDSEASEWQIDVLEHVTPLGSPAAPSGLIAERTLSSGLVLMWTDNANNEAGFEIVRATRDGSTWGSWVVFTADRDSTSFADTTAASSAEYAYFIRSYTAVDRSDWVYVGVPPFGGT